MNVKKPVKTGLGFLVDAAWNILYLTREQAERRGWRLRTDFDTKFGFVPVVCDCGEYFRLNYGRK